MRLTDIQGIFEPLGIPTSYYSFPEDTGQEPPFLVWYIPGSSDLYADDINYHHIAQLTVELYTDEKDFDMEHALEECLTGAGLAWSMTSAYVASEKMWMATYTTEVSINV